MGPLIFINIYETNLWNIFMKQIYEKNLWNKCMNQIYETNLWNINKFNKKSMKQMQIYKQILWWLVTGERCEIVQIWSNEAKTLFLSELTSEHLIVLIKWTLLGSAFLFSFNSSQSFFRNELVKIPLFFPHSISINCYYVFCIFVFNSKADLLIKNFCPGRSKNC